VAGGRSAAYRLRLFILFPTLSARNFIARSQLAIKYKLLSGLDLAFLEYGHWPIDLY
jgi:hypothetical protein